MTDEPIKFEVKKSKEIDLTQICGGCIGNTIQELARVNIDFNCYLGVLQGAIAYAILRMGKEEAKELLIPAVKQMIENAD